MGLSGQQPAQASPRVAIPNVTAHPSTASVPHRRIGVLLYNGPLLCRFNVLVKGLSDSNRKPVVRERDSSLYYS